MQFKALIFDCDGTLVDSEPLGIAVLGEVAAEFGARIDVESSLEALRGLPLADCVVELERRFQLTLPNDFVALVRERTAARFREQLQPMPGAFALLASVQVPFCVASSGPREKIELSLTLTGLRKFFGDRLFSSHDVGTWKPDPGLFLHSARQLGVEPGACAVVEDSQPGVDAGIAAGMFVFAYGNAPLRLPESPRVRAVASHQELQALLQNTGAIRRGCDVSASS